MSSTPAKPVTEVKTVDDIPADILEVLVNDKSRISVKDCERNLALALRVLRLLTGFQAVLTPKENKILDTSAIKEEDKDTKVEKNESREFVEVTLSDDKLASVLPLPQEADELIDTTVLKRNYRVVKEDENGILMVQSSYDNVMLAIKRLPHSAYKFAEQRRNYQQVRFLRYAKGHSNIVSLMRCTMYKEELWLSLEYLLGGTLEEMLEQHALKEKHIKYITRHVTSALAFLHESGIAFRNLSSHHVMFDLKGNAKLIDFSSAKILNFSNVVKRERLEVTSSYDYYAPELVCKRCEDEVVNQGVGVDIWSLGVLVLEMLLRKFKFPTPANALWTSASICDMVHHSSGKGRHGPECLKILLENTNSDPKLSKKWSGFAHEFLRMTLQADPRARAPAKKLLKSAFLMKGIPTRREMCDFIGYVRQLKHEIKL